MLEEAPKLEPIIGENFELVPPEKEEKVERYEHLKSLLEKYDVGEMVEDILNLKWQEKVTVNDFDGEYGASYQVPNKVYVNYIRGSWATSGIAHEMVHLILYQNKWTDIPEISDYISGHQDLKNPTKMRTVGYPIEQMVAYLLMRDVMLEISEKDARVNKEQVLSQYGDSWFNRILEKEYPSEHLKTLGKKIIVEWQNRPKDMPVTDWIKSLLL
ncbi:hypothetical protein ACFL15_00135 [Patescibacteria group bacterium]